MSNISWLYEADSFLRPDRGWKFDRVPIYKLFKISAMKKIKPPEKKAGIWLDQETAYIVHIIGEEEPIIESLKSGVESRIRYPGEGKVSARFGQSFIDDQEKKQHRQRNQREKFFKQIISHIHDEDYFYLFGPGKAKEGLNNAIEKDGSIRGKVAEIETTGMMTGKQALAKAESYFHEEPFRLYKKNLKKLKKAMS